MLLCIITIRLVIISVVTNSEKDLSEFATRLKIMKGMVKLTRVKLPVREGARCLLGM